MWQAWHNLTSTFVLHGRHSPSTFVLHGRRGTISHPPSFCVAGVALMALGGAPGLRDAYVTSTLVSRTMSHTSLSHTICHIPSLSDTICLNVLSHTIFHTIFVNNSLTHNFVTHTHTSSHTIFHTQLCRTPSFTYYLSHVALAQARANGAENPCLPSCVSGLFWHVCFSGLFSSSKSDWSRKLFGHQIQNSCFVYRHVYVAASSACFGMFAFPACLAQAKATGAENGLDIKFIIRLPACLPSYGLDIKFVVAVGQARLSRRISRCTTWSTEDHGTPHSAHSRSAVMPHAEQMTLQR